MEFPEGVVHRVPPDLRETLGADPEALAKWNGLTPLARNEWIWTESAKKPETRACHGKRIRSELKEGKRRPCCRAGCPHRYGRGARKGVTIPAGWSPRPSRTACLVLQTLW